MANKHELLHANRLHINPRTGRPVDPKRSLAAKRGAKTRRANAELLSRRQVRLHHKILAGGAIFAVMVFTFIGIHSQLQTYAASIATGTLTGLGNKCLDNSGARLTNQNHIQLYKCNGTVAQRFTYTSEGYVKANNGSNYCLDIPGSSKAEYTYLQLYKCNGTVAQKFTIKNNTLVSNLTGFCATVKYAETGNGTRIWMKGCHGTAAQKWVANIANLSSGGGSTGSTQPSTASTHVLALGDSLTYGQDAVASAWPIKFQAQTGINTVNTAQAGWTSLDMAVKYGAIDPQISLSGGQIPSGTNPVAVSAISPSSGWRTANGINQAFTGTLSGVPGTLTHNGSTNTWSFKRTSNGSAVKVASGSGFHSTMLDGYRSYDLVIWLGRNDMNYTGYAETIQKDVDAIIAHANKGTRYLVLGVIPSKAIGANDVKNVKALNATLAAHYGKEHFYDLQADLASTAALSRVNITPSATDKSDIANGFVPTSLSTTNDLPHLNAAGYTSVGIAVANKVGELGWKAAPSTGTPPSGGSSGSTGAPSASAPSGNYNLTSVVSGAASGKVLALGSGTYSFKDFNPGYGVDLSKVAGLSGAGIGKTVVQMTPNTSTRKSSVPGASSNYNPDAASTNPLYLLKFAGSPNISNLTVQGTGQGHLYNGIRIDRTTNARVSNVKVSAIPGDDTVPPGETFGINDYATNGSVYTNVEVDGAGVGASNFATNSSQNATINNSYFHGSKFANGAAFWKTNNVTITGTQSSDNKLVGFNFERVTGTVNIRGAKTMNNGWCDYRMVSDTGSATYNIYDPVYSGKLKIRVSDTYNGKTNQQKKSQVHVYINGVDKTSSVVQWI